MATVIWTVPAQMIRKKFYLQGMRDFGTTVANESNDTVVIEDIWDSRRAPQNLTKRIKNKK